MATIEDVLGRLQKVKRAGNGWSALCPAHEEKTPSLTVTEADGKILMHCFAGCEPVAVLDAIGLKFEDLFPDAYEAPSKKRYIAPALALKTIEFEALLLCVVCQDIEAGKPLTADTIARVKKAQIKIREALEMSVAQ